jgi:hypothetical protein
LVSDAGRVNDFLEVDARQCSVFIPLPSAPHL